MLKSADNVKTQINKEYRQEIEGMASKFSGSKQSIRGDGKLSVDEVYLMQLIADVIRSNQCSALGIYGERSVTENTIAYRNMDWNAGLNNQLDRIHAVTTYNEDDKSICTIGFLGYLGIISGFSNNKIFAAILDSGTKGTPYSSESKRSYPFDLRYALENYKTLDDVGNYMKASERNYTFGHLIFLCDSNISKVLENNISMSKDSIRAFRTEHSKLNEGIQWTTDNSIGCVNSFLLEGNYDNHTFSHSNVLRWESLKKEVTAKGNVISLDQLKEIACYYTDKTPGLPAVGDIYNKNTQQIIICEPSKQDYQIFFRPKDGTLPIKPIFEKIAINFKE